MEKIIICDLDGCLINSEWIWAIVNGMGFEKELAYDLFNRMANAEAHQIDLTLLNFLRYKLMSGFKIHFLTARVAAIQEETVRFLEKKTGLVYGKDFSISFRPNNDVLSSAESKRTRLQFLIDDGKEIVLAIDDKDSIIKMYSEMKIPTMKWKIGFIPLSLALEFGSHISTLVGVQEKISQN